MVEIHDNLYRLPSPRRRGSAGGDGRFLRCNGRRNTTRATGQGAPKGGVAFGAIVAFGKTRRFLQRAEATHDFHPQLGW